MRALCQAAALLLALAVLAAAPAGAQTAPVVTIAAGTSPVTEGTSATYTVTASQAAPPGGLVVKLLVSEDHARDFVAPADEGDQTVTIPAGARSVTYRVPTVDDGIDEDNGPVQALIREGGLVYTRGSPYFADVRVDDNDGPPPNVLVSSRNRFSSGVYGAMEGLDLAQSFTTGPNSSTSYLGWTLTSVGLYISQTGIVQPAYSVGIYNTRTTTDRPGSLVGTLAGPGTLVRGVNEFTHSGLGLAANTTYFIVIDSHGGGTGATGVDLTADHAEDPGGAAGWSIGNGHLWRQLGISDPRWADHSVHQELVRFRISGTERLGVSGRPGDDPTYRRPPEPTDLARVPRNVALSPAGLVTWDLDTETEPDAILPYLVQWIASTRPVGSTKREWWDDHVADGSFTSIEEQTCDAGGRCRVRIDDFDPRWHYLVHVNTSPRSAYKDRPPAAVRYTPPPRPNAPRVTIAGGPAVTEGTAATFTVTAEPAPGSDLAVYLSVRDAPGADFVKRRKKGVRTVTIPAGRTRATYAVRTRNDRKAEPGGDVTATLVPASAYRLGGAASATVTVSDNDGGPAPAASPGSPEQTDPPEGTESVEEPDPAEEPGRTGLTVAPAADGEAALDLSWPKVSDSRGYAIQWKTDEQEYTFPERSWSLAGTSDPTQTYRIEDLFPNRTYTVKVTARLPDGSFGPSAEARGTVPALTVQGVEVRTNYLNDTQLTVAWEAAPDAAAYRIEYKEETDPADPFTVSATHSAGSLGALMGTSKFGASVSGLQADTAYTVRVIALHGNPRGPEIGYGEAVGHTRAPFGPITLTAVPDEPTQLDVSWTGFPRDDFFYIVEYREAGSADSFTPVARTDRTATTERLTGLDPDAEYTVRVRVRHQVNQNIDNLVDQAEATTGSQAGGEPGDRDSPDGEGAAGLPGLTVAAVDNEPTHLAVSWDAVQDAATYHLRWKTGAGDYGDSEKTTGTRYTVTGLSPGTSYTVNVAALDGDNTLLAEGVTNGDTAARTGQSTGLSGASDRQPSASTPGNSFVIYHDPHAGAVAAARYDQATTLLTNAGIAYREVTGDVRAEAGRLAGVTNSVMPRFFFGDPQAPGWTSQLKVNNGGLRWLKAHLANLPGLSVADVRVTEAPGATLDFTVTLDKAATGPVTVAYATADGTATAGADYTAASGALRFNAGETSKTITVPVLDDAHDEGAEMLTLRLSNAAGARIADAQATGTIANTDPLPQAWLARFGRTVGTHVTDAISTRLRAGPEASSLTIGGQPVPLRSAQANAANASETGSPTAEPRSSALLEGVARLLGLGPGNTTGDVNRDPRLDQGQTPSLNLRQVLLGSAFRLNLGAGAGSAASPRLTAWGRMAGTNFDGRDSTLTLDGDVLTGAVGLDSTWDRLLLGLAVAHSRGNGAFTQTGPMAGAGTLEQTLTSLHPYLRYAVTDQLDVWGTVGYGWGALTLEQDDQDRLKPDTTLVMGAIGSRGILLSPAESGGYQLATRADAMFTRTTSDAVTGASGNLAETDGDAHRLRMILEGSRALAFAEGRQLTPTLELGLRHDWGDAETGFGLEVGGRVQYVDPALGLTVDGAVRGLVAHEDSAYNEWGASGTIRVAPGAGGQGLALTLAPSWGATASGVEALWTRQTTAGLAPGIGPAQTGRLAAEVGYGFAAFARGLLTPYAGTSLADGQSRTYRLGARWQGTTGLTLSLEGTRQDAMGAQPMNQGLRLQAAWGF